MGKSLERGVRDLWWQGGAKDFFLSGFEFDFLLWKNFGGLLG